MFLIIQEYINGRFIVDFPRKGSNPARMGFYDTRKQAQDAIDLFIIHNS